jgi:hypothetical protein
VQRKESDDMSNPVIVTIQAGVCGFRTVVKASSEDDQNVAFDIQSDCENIRGLASKLKTVDAYDEIGAGFDGVIHQTTRDSLKSCCSGCVVPNGIFKAMQVAASLALPADISIKIEQP